MLTSVFSNKVDNNVQEWVVNNLTVIMFVFHTLVWTIYKNFFIMWPKKGKNEISRKQLNLNK